MHPLLSTLLTHSHRLGASDLHLVSGVPPAMRINGEIICADA
ncbi:MAG: hypothetical protein RLZZ399_1925, partial [Verrucomicrobiota bacterium]